MTALATATLRVVSGTKTGRRLEIGEALRIGRHPYNELSLDDPAASRYHCWLLLNEQGFFVEDLCSTNGTWVNGARVQERRPVRAGDRIRVGSTMLVFGEE